MSRTTAALLAVLLFPTVIPAARAHAQAASPFPEVRLPPEPQTSHLWAYVTIGSGLALVGTSFYLSERANDRYDDYLAATEPRLVADLYEQTLVLDHLSAASLLGGEALFAVGIYLRFLQRPSRLGLALGPGRCAVSLRY